MVGRKKEIEELQKLYESRRAELVAVYGRRRVGKTYLVNHCFTNKFCFKHAGLAPEEENGDSSKQLKKQLSQFYLSLRSYGLADEKEPKDWFEAFFCCVSSSPKRIMALGLSFSLMNCLG